MTVFESLLPAKGVSAHFLDDELLLFSTANQCIYQLNSTAAYAWCLLESGVDRAHVLSEVARVFRMSPEVVGPDMDQVIGEWLELGLVERPGHASADNPTSESGSQEPMRASAPENIDDGAFRCGWFFHLAGATLRLRLPSALEEEAVRPIFSHLETTEAAFHASLDVICRDGEYTVIGDGAVIGTAADATGLGPILSQEALRIAYQSNDYVIAVHAGAVGKDGRSIILAGPSGAGKSTLTAGLIAAGYSYFTDEVAIVERQTHRLIPCPVSLRIKGKSLDLVRRLWKEPLTFCHTVDSTGTGITYVVPPKESLVPSRGEAGPVAALVFPRYDPSCVTALVPMKRSDALRTLQATGYDTHGDLTSAKVTELVAWISQLPCYHLPFESLDRAMVLVGEVLQ